MNNNKYLKKLQSVEFETLKYFQNFCNQNNLNYFLIGGTLLGSVRHKGFIPWDDDIDIGMPRKDYNMFLKMFIKQKNSNYFLDCYKTNKRYWLPYAKLRVNGTVFVENNISTYNGNAGIWIDIFPFDNANKEGSSFLKFRKRFVSILTAILVFKNLKVTTKDFSKFKKVILSLIQFLPNSFFHFLVNGIMQINKNNNSPFIVSLSSRYSIEKQTHYRNKIFPTALGVFNKEKFMIPKDYDTFLRHIYGNNYMQLPPIKERETHHPLRVEFSDTEEIIFDGEKESCL